MKNLVMGVATGYGWHEIEPFVTSFLRHCKSADLVLFVDSVSPFTHAQMDGVKLLPIPKEYADKLIINVRWQLYEKFLEEHGAEYEQVLSSDVRDVIFQGDIFETFKNHKNYLGYATEGTNLNNSQNNANYKWMKNLLGKEVADKLADEEIICVGTVIGTTADIKKFFSKMVELLKNSTIWGDEQAAMNYMIRENLLDIENFVEIDCWTGDIFSVGFFHNTHPINIVDDKILRGDCGVPSLVHQYTKYPVFVKLVNKIFRDRDFQIDENFADARSMMDQTFYLANIGRIDEAYKLFTRYLFGGNFNGLGARLIKLWEATLKIKFTAASELLMMSIQNALMSTNGNGLNFGQVNQMISLADFCMKNNISVSFSFKLFLKNVLFALANQFHAAKQLDQSLTYLDLIEELGTAKDQNFYLFKAKVYRESGKKAEALAAYEKALG